MINFLLVKDKEIPVYLKYWYYKTKIEGLVFNKIYEATKVGTSLVLDNTIEHSMKIKLLSSDTTQDGTPTPDFPQDIHVVKGDNNTNISNKNLFGGFIFAKTSGGITFNYYKDGTITAKGIAIAKALSLLSSEAVNNNFLIKLQPGTYTIQGGISNIFVQVCDKQGSTIVETNSSTSFTINNEKDIFVRIMVSSGTDLSNGVTIYQQLEKGDVATPYVAHEEQSYPISLGNIELCKIGSYQDLIFKNTSDSEYYDSTLEVGKWYKLGKIGKVVLDGSESWVRWGDVSGGNTSIFGTSIIDNLIGVSYFAISNNFINKTSTIWNIDEQAMTVAKQERSIRIRINNTISSSIEAFKAWLSTHNTIVYYVLETPTKTLLSDTLQEQLDNIYNNAHTYDKITNITQINDDRPFILDVSYFRKVKYNE